jgi:integrase
MGIEPTTFKDADMKLADINIKKAKPGDKTRKLTDGGGLFLQIEPTGGKLWRFQYWFEGKRKLLALGKYPDVPLQEARRRHAEAREQLARGIDPAAAKKALKLAGAERAANSFEVVAREWFATWKADKAESHYSKVIARLEKDVFPYVGKRPIAGIKAPDVLDVLRKIENRGIVDTAHKAKYSISQVFRYAVASGRAEHDPCPDLRGALKPIRESHYPTLTDPAKVAVLLRDIDDYKGGAIVRAALRLAPLVFVRPGELRAAKWADIDLDGGDWRFITSKTKTEHLVPLAPQAVEILKDLQSLTGYGEYVFAGIRAGRPIADATLNRALQTMGYDTAKDICPHGFRAMARTLLAERLRFPENVIEHQLAHKVPDALGAAYNRTKFIDDRRRMMTIWADYLDELKAGKTDNVVPAQNVE